MDEIRIKKEMLALSEKISYKFKKIRHLADAMYSKKLKKHKDAGKNYEEWTNEALAQVGDSILSFLLTDFLYRCSEEVKRDGVRRKGLMNDRKADKENNSLLHKIEEQEGLLSFAYHDTHFHSDFDIKDQEKVTDKEHSPYLEAITAAIYYDGGFDAVKKWFEDYLLPLIEKYSEK